MKIRMIVAVMGGVACVAAQAQAGGSSCTITPGNRAVHVVGCKGTQNRTPTLPPGQGSTLDVCQGDEVTWDLVGGKPSGQAMITIVFDKGDRVSPTDPVSPSGDGAATARISWNAARNRAYDYSIQVTGCADPLDPRVVVQ